MEKKERVRGSESPANTGLCIKQNAACRGGILESGKQPDAATITLVCIHGYCWEDILTGRYLGL